jgi:5-methylcytosine-specific restriction endonuclease McrA
MNSPAKTMNSTMTVPMAFECDIHFQQRDLHAILLAQLGRACLYCREGLTARTVSADHRQPVSRNGKHQIDNLVICCERCN